MKFSLLLFILFKKLKKAVKSNTAYRSYIGEIRLKILMKTADGRRGRLFIFDRGKLSSRSGAGHAADAALVWSDAATAFRVMASGSDEEMFLAAANGKVKVEGMAYFIQWFGDGVKLVMQ
ncbi:MAG: hypothetical protein A2W19_11120 [Spirochaetes bacterium RBG_16_49_21]|nr:MAG: hypothetical protein A2W19_11120 [Spirochaetes bacterium RBG_16_49_21]